MSTQANAVRPLALVVLAAGKGTRLPSARRPPQGAGRRASARRCSSTSAARWRASPPTRPWSSSGTAAQVRAWLDKHWTGVRPVVQEPQHGTGHAVRVALEAAPALRRRRARRERRRAPGRARRPRAAARRSPRGRPGRHRADRRRRRMPARSAASCATPPAASQAVVEAKDASDAPRCWRCASSTRASTCSAPARSRPRWRRLPRATRRARST